MTDQVEWLYRAGDSNGPCFHGKDEPEVWMFKTLKLFPPFHGDEENGCVVWKLSLHEVEEAIVQYESDDNVCVAYVDEENREQFLVKALSSLKWSKIDPQEYPPYDDRGYPTINHVFVARAAKFYAKEKQCHSPDDFNTMAEVKAAAFWRFPDGKPKKSVEGDVTDPVLQMAAMFTWNKLVDKCNAFRKKYDDAFDENKLEHLQKLTEYEIDQETIGGISSYLHLCEGSSSNAQTASTPNCNVTKPVLEQLCEKLKSYYLMEMSYIEEEPWKMNSKGIDIEKMYTRQAIYKNESKGATVSQVALKSYRDIFEGNTTVGFPWRVKIVASQGMGKSTLIRKLAVDWARSKSLSQFRFCIVINLSETEKQRFKDILFSSKVLKKFSQDEKNELYDFIETNQSEVLLIIDEIDKSVQSNRLAVEDVVIGHHLNKCCVVVATSDSSISDRLKKYSHLFAEYTILGFNRSDMKCFVQTYFDSSVEVVPFLDFVCSHELYNYGRIPLFLSFFCYLWKRRDANEELQSKTAMYKKIVQCIFSYMFPTHSLQAFDQINLYELGKKAADSFAPLCVSRDCVEEQVHIQLILRMNIDGRLVMSSVTKRTTLQPTRTIHFYHQSIQEFFAAWFTTRTNQAVKFLERHLYSLERCYQFRDLTGFICGLASANCVLDVFSLLKDLRNDDRELERFYNNPEREIEYNSAQQYIRNFQNLCLELLLECNDKEKALEGFLDCIGGSLLFPDECNVPYKLLMNIITETSNKKPITRVALSIKGSDKDLILSQLDFIGKLTRAEKLKCPNKAEQMQTILGKNGKMGISLTRNTDAEDRPFYVDVLAVHRDNQHKPEVDQTTQEESEQEIVAFILQLLSLSNLRVLCLRLNLMYQMPLQYLSNMQSIMKGLVQLDISGNNLKAALSNPLPEMPNLVQLRMLGSVINDSSLEGLKKSFENLAALKEIDIDLSFFAQSKDEEDEVVVVFFQSLRKLTKLTVLVLQDAHLLPKTMSELSKEIEELQQLEELHLIGGVTRSHPKQRPGRNRKCALEKFANGLAEKASMRKLKLQDIGASPRHTADLFLILKRLPKLKVLDLSNNDFFGDDTSSGDSILRYISQDTELEALHMSGTSLGRREVDLVSKQLSNLEWLKTLDLSRNPLGDGINTLASKLCSIENLEELFLVNTEMSEQNAEKLAENFACVPKLHCLDVSENSIGSAVNVIAAKLQELQKLACLILRKTSTSSDSVGVLLREVSKLPSLRSLDLSENGLNGYLEECIANTSELGALCLLNSSSRRAPMHKSCLLQIET